MATSYTPRLLLPEIADGEGSAYVTYNDLARILDGLVQGIIQSRTLTAPPGGELEGQCWYVPTGATGAWAGHDGELAQWYGGIWRFIPLTQGMAFWVVDLARYWQVVKPGIHAVMALSGAGVAHTITTTPQTFQIADVDDAASNAPAPTTIDLVNSRFTINDFVSDFPISVGMHASLSTTGNNILFTGQIYKNGSPAAALKSSYTASNQSANAVLSIVQGIAVVKSGDTIDIRFVADTGSNLVTFDSFTFSILPIY